jgi:hypothetical protein
MVASCGHDHAPGEKCAHETKEQSVKGANISSVKRTVEPPETITVPAGTFDCTVITEEVRFRAMVVFSQTMRMRTWYAEGVGEVRKQELDRRGRVESTSQLVSAR